MKAAVIEHVGERGSLRDVPMPHAGPLEILVRVTAAGVNPMDWKVRDGGNRPMPFVLGQDFAGVVSATGERVTKYKEGQRIFGIARQHGAYAEYTVVPQDDRAQPIAKIPDDVGDADAAALPTAGLTALASVEALRVEKGSTLLVVGATGGVGGFAVQMARDRGARIIGVAGSSTEKLARSLGVEEFIAYDRDDVLDSLERLGALDAVLDLVDDANAMQRLASMIRRGGRIVSTIGAADAGWFAQRGITAIDLSLTHTPQSSHAGLRTLLELLQRGAIRVVIVRERPLSEAADALDESKSGKIDGKLVLTVD